MIKQRRPDEEALLMALQLEAAAIDDQFRKDAGRPWAWSTVETPTVASPSMTAAFARWMFWTTSPDIREFLPSTAVGCVGAPWGRRL